MTGLPHGSPVICLREQGQSAQRTVTWSSCAIAAIPSPPVAAGNVTANSA
jgi:hypothetical protein